MKQSLKKLEYKLFYQNDRLYKNFANPVTHDKYRAYLNLFKVLVDILRSNNYSVPREVFAEERACKLKASQDSEGNLVLDAFYRRQNFFRLHLRYGFVERAELPLLRVNGKVWVEGYHISTIMDCVEVLQKYEDVSESPIFWDFTGSYKQLKSKYICSDGVTRYEKI